MKGLFISVFCFLHLFAGAQSHSNISEKDMMLYRGKYETGGIVVQVILENKSLALIVPGAPVQKLIPVDAHTFKTNTFSDEVFTFTIKNGKVESLTSDRAGMLTVLKKIADKPDEFGNTDQLLPLKKSGRHFNFRYSKADAKLVDSIESNLESNYARIIHDLDVTELPVITVRIYPTLKSFHDGINFPRATENILATAFGKNDLRMVSPRVGVDSFMFVQGLAHEFTHCVHLNIDYSPNNPRWLWEGVAMFEANWFLDPKEIDVIKNRQFPSLAYLGNGMEYILGYVIIEAIRELWGVKTIPALIKKQGNVQEVLNLSMEEFEKKVFEYIYKKYIGK